MFGIEESWTCGAGGGYPGQEDLGRAGAVQVARAGQGGGGDQPGAGRGAGEGHTYVYEMLPRGSNGCVPQIE